VWTVNPSEATTTKRQHSTHLKKGEKNVSRFSEFRALAIIRTFSPKKTIAIFVNSVFKSPFSRSSPSPQKLKIQSLKASFFADFILINFLTAAFNI
jgi:hypothetical protein